MSIYIAVIILVFSFKHLCRFDTENAKKLHNEIISAFPFYQTKTVQLSQPISLCIYKPFPLSLPQRSLCWIYSFIRDVQLKTNTNVMMMMIIEFDGEKIGRNVITVKS